VDVRDQWFVNEGMAAELKENYYIGDYEHVEGIAVQVRESTSHPQCLKGI
jgi:hypothetical protein